MCDDGGDGVERVGEESEIIVMMMLRIHWLRVTSQTPPVNLNPELSTQA